MNPRFAILGAFAILAAAPVFADDFGDGLTGIQNEWAVAKYQTPDKAARGDAFSALLKHASEFSAQYPDRAEAHAWEGIVLSTYAGEVSAMSAMKYAKAARVALTASSCSTRATMPEHAPRSSTRSPRHPSPSDPYSTPDGARKSVTCSTS